MVSTLDYKLSKGARSTAIITRSILTSKLFKLMKSVNLTMMTRKLRTGLFWWHQFCLRMKRWSRLTMISWLCTLPSKDTQIVSVRQFVGCQQSLDLTHRWSSSCQIWLNKFSNSLFQCSTWVTFYSRYYWRPGWTETILKLKCHEF